jgi:protein SCO1/2
MMPMARALAIAAVMSVGLPQFLPGAAETRLIDQYERPLDARELSGRWLLVYFGYASCSEICPAALSTMTAVLKRLGPSADSIDPLFVTLDPIHDSPAVMRAFVAHFDPHIRALTGTPQAVAEAAHTFGVPWKAAASGAAASSAVDHGVFYYLVAPDGTVVQILHPQQQVGELAAAIRRHLAAARG